MKKYDDETLKSVRAFTVQQLLGLQNNGRRIAIKCPLHSERTGSFVIYPDGDFYCYSCTKSGNNALDLLILMGNSFQDSVDYILQHR